MFSKKTLCILLAGMLTVGIIMSQQQQQQQEDTSMCSDKKDCLTNNKCQCYCSRKCGPRKKETDDKPVWANGRCFCKEWDRRNYDRCSTQEYEDMSE